MSSAQTAGLNKGTFWWEKITPSTWLTWTVVEVEAGRLNPVFATGPVGWAENLSIPLATALGAWLCGGDFRGSWGFPLRSEVSLPKAPCGLRSVAPKSKGASTFEADWTGFRESLPLTVRGFENGTDDPPARVGTVTGGFSAGTDSGRVSSDGSPKVKPVDGLVFVAGVDEYRGKWGALCITKGAFETGLETLGASSSLGANASSLWNESGSRGFLASDGATM